jgi:hypothetical protein
MIRDVMRDQDADALLGKAMVGVGAGGSMIQWMTDFANTFVLLGNAALVLGGGYLLLLRIIKAHRDLKQPPSNHG